MSSLEFRTPLRRPEHRKITTPPKDGSVDAAMRDLKKDVAVEFDELPQSRALSGDEINRSSADEIIADFLDAYPDQKDLLMAEIRHRLAVANVEISRARAQELSSKHPDNLLTAKAIQAAAVAVAEEQQAAAALAVAQQKSAVDDPETNNQLRREHRESLMAGLSKFGARAVYSTDKDYTETAEKLLPREAKNILPRRLLLIDQPVIRESAPVRFLSDREPRLQLLLETLTKLGVQYELIIGQPSAGEQSGYAAVVINPQPQRAIHEQVIFVNDQKGNASYIAHVSGKDVQAMIGATSNQLRFCRQISGLIEPRAMNTYQDLAEFLTTSLQRPVVALPDDFAMNTFADETKFERAPAGCKSFRTLYSLFSCDNDTLQREIDRVLVAKGKAGMVGWLLNTQGVMIEQYFPAMEDELRKTLPPADYESLEPDWHTAHSFFVRLKAEGLPASLQTVNRRVQELATGWLEVNSSTNQETFNETDWVKVGSSGSNQGGQSTHYRSALADYIYENLKLERTIPQGFREIGDWGQEIYQQIDNPQISLEIFNLNLEDEAEKLASQHAEWKLKQSFYHENLIALAKPEVISYAQRGGWQFNELAKALGITNKAISYHLDKINRPDLIKMRRVARNVRHVPVLDPELVQMIQAKFAEAPTTHISQDELAEIYNTSEDNIRLRIRNRNKKRTPPLVPEHFRRGNRGSIPHWPKKEIFELLGPYV